MTDELDDMGFDAVIAGEVWKPPEDIKPALINRDYPKLEPTTSSDPESRHNPREPVTVAVTGDEIKAPNLVMPGLTPEGVQAAKALVMLPPLTAPELARLARELAMDVKEQHTILREFNLTQVQYDFLEANNAFFKAALQAACIEWHAPLNTQERIKVEAAAILEDSLPGLGVRMQNRGEGLPGVIEAAKLFAKVAGVGERENSGAGTGERFTINIDLGGDQKITVSTAQAQEAHPQLDTHLRISEDPQAAGSGPPIHEVAEGAGDAL